MSKRFFAAVLGAGALAVGALTAGVAGADAAARRTSSTCRASTPSGSARRPRRPVTPPASPRSWSTRQGAVPRAAAPLSTALSPTQLKAAYGLPSTGGTGRTVAIVDAFGYPNLERDLTIYRNFYGMPACTTANGCLKIRNQTGGTTPPRTNLGWDQEQALDVDAVSAACPGCNILVVQAKSAPSPTWEQRSTRRQRRPVWSRSPTATAAATRPTRRTRTFYNHPGIAVTASTGDNGYAGCLLPGLVGLRHRRGRHLADDVGHQPRERDRVERRRLRLLDAQHRARRCGELQHRLRQASHGRRLRRGRPEHRRPERLRADDARRTPRGRSTAAPASPRRSSRRSTRWRAAATATRRRTRTRRACTTSPAAATAPAPPPSGATPAPAGTGRRDSARRTAPGRSDRPHDSSDEGAARPGGPFVASRPAR